MAYVDALVLEMVDDAIVSLMRFDAARLEAIERRLLRPMLLPSQKRVLNAKDSPLPVGLLGKLNQLQCCIATTARNLELLNRLACTSRKVEA